MNKVERLKTLVGKEIWIQTMGSSSQGTLVSVEGGSCAGEVCMKPDNAAYSDLFIDIEFIEQIKVGNK